MPSKDYKALYKFQDQFLKWFAALDTSFYLTGGTALSRFYLNHRYSDDLDFFVNGSKDFEKTVQSIVAEIVPHFQTDLDALIITADFCRLFILQDDIVLKIEFVNDVPARIGAPHKTMYGLVDAIENILANKLTALVGRDEPKDVFDIITIACNYSFDWQTAMHWAKQKAVINELDVENRLMNFPLTNFENAYWLTSPFNAYEFEAFQRQVGDDILKARRNHLGEGKQSILAAKVLSGNPG